MKHKHLRLALLFSVAALSVSATESYTLTSSKDNTIIESADGSMANSTGLVYIGNIAKGLSIRRGLFAFDLSEIPAETVIDSVKFILTFNSASDNTIEVHKVTSDWGEGTSYSGGGAGVAATTNDVTWLHSVYNTVSWTTAGGDFESTISATATIASTDASVTFKGTQLTADVQAWIAGTSSNYGWLLKSNDESTASGMIEKTYSKETATTDAQKPTLYVYYTTTGITSASATGISVYPTVANSSINVNAENLHKVEIFDYCGKLIMQTKEKNINVSGLQKGIYFVRISAETATVTKQIIKL
ncbi:MAG: DNRLRE domain-containing protein [Paludibacter sp.]|nr:DNRLRE domain-containing protein [Paludibacter sp.]